MVLNIDNLISYLCWSYTQGLKWVTIMILNPIPFFRMYSQNVASIICRHDLYFHCYADDVRIYAIFNPNVPGDAACAIFKLSKYVEEVRNWLKENMLKLNDSKTEFFISSPPFHETRLADTKIHIGDAEIHPSSTVKNLGVHFDAAMTMSDQVTAICKSVNFHLWNLSRIRKYITQEACSNAMRALVLSKLDYANALLSYLTNKDIIRLQHLQNRAALIIFQVPRRHSFSPLLKSLHWLPVDSHIKFKIILYIYKIRNNMTPVYLSNCVKVYVPAREGLALSNGCHTPQNTANP